MRWSRLKKLTPFFLALWLLTACGTNDTPFSLVGDTNAPEEAPAPEGSGSVTPPIEGCIVNFIGTIQLKVSAEPGNDPIEVLDARPVNIDPVPFIVDGGNISLPGDSFPTIVLDRLNDSADLKLTGVSGFSATGTYDSGTGAIEIPGYKLNLEILDKTTGQPIINDKEIIEGLNFTTDAVTATGNLNPIEEQGSPLDPSDLSVTLVVGLTLPDSFQKLPPLNGKINGGALTARFEGVFDQAPENCTQGGGGSPPPAGAAGGGPKDLMIKVDGKEASEIDFGSALVLVKQQEGETILNCEEAGNRGAVTKMVEITNTGTGNRSIKLLKGIDTDSDSKDPLCSGSSEFVRGSIRTEGQATCGTLQVGGKDFTTEECTIPEGSEESKIIFPLIYLPYNFVTPSQSGAVSTPDVPEGDGDGSAEPAPSSNAVVDTGSLIIEYDDQNFAMPLKGITEPDTSEALSVSKLTAGETSKKEIPSGGLIKIAVETANSFTQDFVIKNGGTDSWENISFALKGNDQGTSNFSVTPGSDTNLGAAAGSDSPGTFAFSIDFNPDGSSQSFDDVLTISLQKVGSTAQVDLIFNIQGTVGVDPILGNYQFKIDFMTALINNSLQGAPVESLDFRDFVEQAPSAQTIVFHDPDAEEFEPLDLLPNLFDLSNSSLSERRTALRILNAQGSGLVPGDDSSLCNEAQDINKPYPAGQDTGGGKQDCSYFYFNLETEDGVQGKFDDETGDLTLPDISLRIQNPYHDDIQGVWPASNPPNTNILDTVMKLSLTTKTLDRLTDETTGLSLVSDSRISNRSQLNLERSVFKEALFGKDCVDPDPVKSLAHPHFKCYLTPDGKYLQGRPVSLREGQQNIFDVIMVGVGKFNPNTLSGEQDIPVFLSDSIMYLVIQARLCPEGVSCDFK